MVISTNLSIQNNLCKRKNNIYWPSAKSKNDQSAKQIYVNYEKNARKNQFPRKIILANSLTAKTNIYVGNPCQLESAVAPHTGKILKIASTNFLRWYIRLYLYPVGKITEKAVIRRVFFWQYGTVF